MESIMWTVKLVIMYGFEAFVIAVVGATVIAGLYQLIRDHGREELRPPDRGGAEKLMAARDHRESQV